MKKLNCRVFYFKVILRFLCPVSRMRKVIRKQKMKQLKISMGIMLASFIILTCVLYWKWNNITADHKSAKLKSTTELNMGTPIRHIPLNEIYVDNSRHYPNESYEFEDHNKPVNLINTVGCKIPVSIINYQKLLKSDKKTGATCGKRAVFLKKVDKDKVQALIKPRVMKKYLRKSMVFDCCYRFLSRSTLPRYEDKKLRFTNCVKFQDNAIITLQTDFINVKCFDYDKRNVSHTIYDDVYAFAKRLNLTKPRQSNCKIKYNVLMIGMDSMSLPRFSMSLSRTVAYFQDNSWPGYRGYHKVDDNTFPNLMAVLSGRNLTDISNKCSNKMDQCHNVFIWNKFKEAGYVTAYGEDYLRLPDTFTNKYAFKIPPTDHYMRPFFLKGETELCNKSLVCAGKVSSGQQLLNYALDFANTYRSDQFFGLFWMNSFSHNANSRPQDADVMMENFFNQLAYTGVMKNTFVIVLGDHGLRFGEHRMKVESYYDDRLPCLFILAPEKFRGRHLAKFKSLAVNQFRLVTPYDLHHTLNEINEISACRNTSSVVLEACPKCHSLFEIASANRTCQDVAIHNKWCSCHKLYPLPVQDTEGDKSVQTAVSHIKELIRSIKTKRCWGCTVLSLKKIIRTHFYYSDDKVSLYYVVAFTLSPGNVSYEATVLLKDGKREVVGPINAISYIPHRRLGKCNVRSKDRNFCICEKIENC